MTFGASAATPAAWSPICIDGSPLEAIAAYKYLGSWLSESCTLDKELSVRIGQAIAAAVRLRNVWRIRSIGLVTKIKIYKSLVITIFLHGAEAWPLTEAQTAKLETFHQRQLRIILRISWWQHISNTEVLQRAKIYSIGDRIRQVRMLWLGHVMRMGPSRIPYQTLFGQLSGRRRAGRSLSLTNVYSKDLDVLRGGLPNGLPWIQATFDKRAWKNFVLGNFDTSPQASAPAPPFQGPPGLPTAGDRTLVRMGLAPNNLLLPGVPDRRPYTPPSGPYTGAPCGQPRGSGKRIRRGRRPGSFVSRARRSEDEGVAPSVHSDGCTLETAEVSGAESPQANAGNNAFKDNDAEVALAELLMLTNVTRANVNATCQLTYVIGLGPKKPRNTLRFVAVLRNYLDESQVTSREIHEGYRFWEHTLNSKGGIRAGGRNITVEVRFGINQHPPNAPEYNEQHLELMQQAVADGEVDFLLGGESDIASVDSIAAQITKRSTILCCHGPPTVYIRSQQQALDENTSNWLFGIHRNSELYTDKLIRNIVINRKAKNIAVVVLKDLANPNNTVFTRTTGEAAIKQLQAMATTFKTRDPPKYTEIVVPTTMSTSIEYFRKLARNMSVAGVDVVLGCTLNNDGKLLIQALNELKVPLRALFVTVTPTIKESVASLSEQGISAEYVLSAGQWHPELQYTADIGQGEIEDDPGEYLWLSAGDFAEKFSEYVKSLTGIRGEASYIHASAAAAGLAVQLAVGGVFNDNFFCFFTNTTADTVSLTALLEQESWTCEYAKEYQYSGYGLIRSNLQFLDEGTFFGRIAFNSKQQNEGSDSVTFQLLESVDTIPRASQAIDFGPLVGENTSARLIQEVVLPSQYETKSLVLPRPPLRGFFDFCDDGYGLNKNNDCEQCDAGFYLTAEAAAVSITDCTCSPGFYNPGSQNGTACLPCPEGARCPGGDAKLLIEPGYWSEPFDPARKNASIHVFACDPGSVCVNTGEEVCQRGYGGNLCMQSLALFTAWMQLMSLVGEIRVNWPKSLTTFFSVASFFAFEVDVVSLRCFDPTWNFLSDMILQYCLPLGLIFALCVWSWLKIKVLYKLKKSFKHTQQGSGSGDQTPEEAGRRQTLQWVALEKHGMHDNVSYSNSSVSDRKQEKLSVFGIARAKVLASQKTEAINREDVLIIFGQRVFSILETTYLASTLYALSALRYIEVGGKKVVARAPATMWSSAVIVLGSVGLAFYAILFPLVMFFVLWSWSPDCPYRKRPKGVLQEEDPGDFQAKKSLLYELYAHTP
ncbi:hypothetical protein KSW81_008369 [Nannochloris sp. 'desiccata']|nr:hypothetical protein KSW81_008369 [Chlorella desiccata (nom. nud.)]